MCGYQHPSPDRTFTPPEGGVLLSEKVFYQSFEWKNNIPSLKGKAIVTDFESIMEQPMLRNLFFYTPLIAAMAGNVGVQSSAIIVQGIANDIVKGSLFNILVKEIGLSLINGLALAVVILIFGQFINQSFLVSTTIAGSMVLVILVAALVGTFVPIILNKQGLDPAIATGPFITTANDIFGIFLFFYFAKIILGF